MATDNLSYLAALIAVSRERSFTRAAKQLGVSPSALSHAIRSLETQVGLRLLNRTTRNVAPTEAGQRLLQTVGPRIEAQGRRRHRLLPERVCRRFRTLKPHQSLR